MSVHFMSIFSLSSVHSALLSQQYCAGATEDLPETEQIKDEYRYTAACCLSFYQRDSDIIHPHWEVFEKSSTDSLMWRRCQRSHNW